MPQGPRGAPPGGPIARAGWLKKGPAPTKSASVRSRANVANAASISRLAAGVEDLDLQPHGARSRFHVSQRDLGVSIGRIDEHGHSSGCGHQLTQELQPLCRQLAVRKLTPVRLPPGRARLATRPSLTGSSATTKTMGIVVVAALAANAAGGPPVVAITATRRRTNSAASSGSRSS